MSIPLPIKVEEDDFTIDLSYQEDLVCQWDACIRRHLVKGFIADSEFRLDKLMKEYVKSLQEEIKTFEDRDELRSKILSHISFFHHYRTELRCCFMENYLENMEDILKEYCELEVDMFSANKRQYETLNRFTQQANLVCKRMLYALKVYLLNRENHMVHVLIKVIMNPFATRCEAIWVPIYSKFLQSQPKDISDEAFCRAYILYQSWKEFLTDAKKKHLLDSMLFCHFERKPESVEDNEILKRVLKPKTNSTLGSITHITGQLALIGHQYFEHMRKKVCLDDGIEDAGLNLTDDEQYSADWDSGDNDFKNALEEVVENMSNNTIESDVKQDDDLVLKPQPIVIIDDDIELVHVALEVPSPSKKTMSTKFLDSIVVTERVRKPFKKKMRNYVEDNVDSIKDVNVQTATTTCPCPSTIVSYTTCRTIQSSTASRTSPTKTVTSNAIRCNSETVCEANIVKSSIPNRGNSQTCNYFYGITTPPSDLPSEDHNLRTTDENRVYVDIVRSQGIDNSGTTNKNMASPQEYHSQDEDKQNQEASDNDEKECRKIDTPVSDQNINETAQTPLSDHHLSSQEDEDNEEQIINDTNVQTKDVELNQKKVEPDILPNTKKKDELVSDNSVELQNCDHEYSHVSELETKAEDYSADHDLSEIISECVIDNVTNIKCNDISENMTSDSEIDINAESEEFSLSFDDDEADLGHTSVDVVEHELNPSIGLSETYVSPKLEDETDLKHMHNRSSNLPNGKTKELNNDLNLFCGHSFNGFKPKSIEFLDNKSTESEKEAINNTEMKILHSVKLKNRIIHTENDFDKFQESLWENVTYEKLNGVGTAYMEDEDVYKASIHSGSSSPTESPSYESITSEDVLPHFNNHKRIVLVSNIVLNSQDCAPSTTTTTNKPLQGILKKRKSYHHYYRKVRRYLEHESTIHKKWMVAAYNCSMKNIEEFRAIRERKMKKVMKKLQSESSEALEAPFIFVNYDTGAVEKGTEKKIVTTLKKEGNDLNSSINDNSNDSTQMPSTTSLELESFYEKSSQVSPSNSPVFSNNTSNTSPFPSLVPESSSDNQCSECMSGVQQQINDFNELSLTDVPENVEQLINPGGCPALAEYLQGFVQEEILNAEFSSNSDLIDNLVVSTQVYPDSPSNSEVPSECKLTTPLESFEQVQILPTPAPTHFNIDLKPKDVQLFSGSSVKNYVIESRTPIIDLPKYATPPISSTSSCRYDVSTPVSEVPVLVVHSTSDLCASLDSISSFSSTNQTSQPISLTPLTKYSAATTVKAPDYLRKNYPVCTVSSCSSPPPNKIFQNIVQLSQSDVTFHSDKSLKTPVTTSHDIKCTGQIVDDILKESMNLNKSLSAIAPRSNPLHNVSSKNHINSVHSEFSYQSPPKMDFTPPLDQSDNSNFPNINAVYKLLDENIKSNSTEQVVKNQNEYLSNNSNCYGNRELYNVDCTSVKAEEDDKVEQPTNKTKNDHDEGDGLSTASLPLKKRKMGFSSLNQIAITNKISRDISEVLSTDSKKCFPGKNKKMMSIAECFLTEPITAACGAISPNAAPREQPPTQTIKYKTPAERKEMPPSHDYELLRQNIDRHQNYETNTINGVRKETLPAGLAPDPNYFAAISALENTLHYNKKPVIVDKSNYYMDNNIQINKRPRYDYTPQTSPNQINSDFNMPVAMHQYTAPTELPSPPQYYAPYNNPNYNVINQPLPNQIPPVACYLSSFANSGYEANTVPTIEEVKKPEPTTKKKRQTTRRKRTKR